MDDLQLAELTAWITEAGLAGQSEIATLTGFCEWAVRFGLPIARAIVLADTLHPIYEGRAFRWNLRGARNHALRWCQRTNPDDQLLYGRQP